jgi:hypothetical protein
MATVRILYWKEIPVQIETQDVIEKVSTPLDPKFQEAVDAIAMFDNSYGTDEYLDAWEWSNSYELKGSAKETLKTVATKYNTQFPADLVKLIRDAQKAGTRKTEPGAIDHWMKNQ